MKPENVRNAQARNDTEALSRMGRKGARVANEKRAEKRDIEETLAAIEAEERAADLRQVAEERHDDLLPEDDR